MLRNLQAPPRPQRNTGVYLSGGHKHSPLGCKLNRGHDLPAEPFGLSLPERLQHWNPPQSLSAPPWSAEAALSPQAATPSPFLGHSWSFPLCQTNPTPRAGHQDSMERFRRYRHRRELVQTQPLLSGNSGLSEKPKHPPRMLSEHPLDRSALAPWVLARDCAQLPGASQHPPEVLPPLQMAPGKSRVKGTGTCSAPQWDQHQGGCRFSPVSEKPGTGWGTRVHHGQATL